MSHEILDPLQPQSAIIELIRDSLPSARFHYAVEATVTVEGRTRRVIYSELYPDKGSSNRSRGAFFGSKYRVIQFQVGDTYQKLDPEIQMIHGKNDGTHGSQRKTT